MGNDLGTILAIVAAGLVTAGQLLGSFQKRQRREAKAQVARLQRVIESHDAREAKAQTWGDAALDWIFASVTGRQAHNVEVHALDNKAINVPGVPDFLRNGIRAAMGPYEPDKDDDD